MGSKELKWAFGGFRTSSLMCSKGNSPSAQGKVAAAHIHRLGQSRRGIFKPAYRGRLSPRASSIVSLL